jgi:hypothetical protein
MQDVAPMTCAAVGAAPSEAAYAPSGALHDGNDQFSTERCAALIIGTALGVGAAIVTKQSRVGSQHPGHTASPGSPAAPSCCGLNSSVHRSTDASSGARAPASLSRSLPKLKALRPSLQLFKGGSRRMDQRESDAQVVEPQIVGLRGCLKSRRFSATP